MRQKIAIAMFVAPFILIGGWVAYDLITKSGWRIVITMFLGMCGIIIYLATAIYLMGG